MHFIKEIHIHVDKVKKHKKKGQKALITLMFETLQ